MGPFYECCTPQVEPTESADPLLNNEAQNPCPTRSTWTRLTESADPHVDSGQNQSSSRTWAKLTHPTAAAQLPRKFLSVSNGESTAVVSVAGVPDEKQAVQQLQLVGRGRQEERSQLPLDLGKALSNQLIPLFMLEFLHICTFFVTVFVGEKSDSANDVPVVFQIWMDEVRNAKTLIPSKLL